MRNYLQKFILLILFFGFTTVGKLLAQPRFTATISPATIGKNETAELKLMIENAGAADNFVAPSLKDFFVLSGPNQESGMENNNGITKQYIGISYILKPRAKGIFTIGPALAKVDGKFLKTNPIKLKVTNAAANSNQNNNNNSGLGGLQGFFDEPVIREKSNKDFILKEGENVAAKIAKNIFIKLIVDKTTCFIGEPIVVTYKLYSRLKSESSISKNPYLNGFSVIDLIQAGTTAYDIEKIDGREYNVYTLRKAQLYPLQSGAMEVEIAEVENTIHFIKESYLKNHPDELNDVINGLPPEALQDEKVTLQTKPVTITVKALPELNKPASFKGAVGNFKIEAAVEKNIFTTDETGKLQVVVTGQGNMELMNAPEVNFADSIESFEPKIIESLNRQSVPVSGSKSYVYSFTIKNPGRYTLPAVEYSFFDNKSGRYNTIATEPIVIVVTKGIGKISSPINKNTLNSGKKSFLSLAFDNPILVITPLGMLLIGLLFLWFKKSNKNKVHATVVSHKVQPVDPIKKQVEVTPNIVAATTIINPLINTEAMLMNKNAGGFYEAINKEMTNFLSSKLDIPIALVNRKTIAAALEKNGVDVGMAHQTDQLLQQIEWQLYTPFSQEDLMEKMYRDALEITTNLLVS